MKVWRAAAWSHALKQARGWKEDRIIFDYLLESPAFLQEMQRRRETQSNLLAQTLPPVPPGLFAESGESREVIEAAGNESLAGERRERLLQYGFGTDVRFVKFSEGLYINVTGFHWYDCRVPRNRNKKPLPQPPPELVLRSSKKGQESGAER
mmetsp:Transcript_40720/g.128348  ORF Transcript_40720/g.128348 Transcript_40720/m.128348 type:complete len:152 (+) Transcript_40720:387-842(+)